MQSGALLCGFVIILLSVVFVQTSRFKTETVWCASVWICDYSSACFCSNVKTDGVLLLATIMPHRVWFILLLRRAHFWLIHSLNFCVKCAVRLQYFNSLWCLFTLSVVHIMLAERRQVLLVLFIVQIKCTRFIFNFQIYSYRISLWSIDTVLTLYRITMRNWQHTVPALWKSQCHNICISKMASQLNKNLFVSRLDCVHRTTSGQSNLT